jgi:hypothetical protein
VIVLITSKVYCVWYPSGGFGHFINAVLTLYGKNFVRPKKQLNFSETGDSHGLDLVAPKYFHDSPYEYNFNPLLTYSVLIDNGINNTGTRFKDSFPNSTIIKICYTDYTWPVIARTMIEKAKCVPFDSEVAVDPQRWPSTDNWAIREKYFLFLRDNKLRYAWRPDDHYSVITVDTLLDYYQFQEKLLELGIYTEDFKITWQQWNIANSKFINPIQIAKNIIAAINNNQHIEISQYQDLWTQAIVNYYIWLEFHFEVPANDYLDWFTNTKDIAIILSQHGVIIDSN